MFDTKKIPVLKIVIIIWLIFTTLYLVFSEYNRLNFVVGQTAYNSGVHDTLAQIMAGASQCQPVPLTIDSNTIEVIGTKCQQLPEAAQPAETKVVADPAE